MSFTDAGIFGFDVSFYQDNNETPAQINFTKMRDYGASFCISKAGQWYYQDQDFQYNWRESALAEIPRASYWFGDKRETGKKQAQTYFDILVTNGYSGEMCFIDYETGSWTDWNQLYNFLYELKRISGLPDDRIGVYTGYYYWKENCPPEGESKEYFKRFPLWLAQYGVSIGSIKIPNPWTECLILQTGTPAIGIDAGVESKEIDYNVFNGDSDKFKLYFTGSPTIPEEPTEGETMTTYIGKGKATPNVRIRKTYPDGLVIGAIVPDQPFEADARGQDSLGRFWLRITKLGTQTMQEKYNQPFGWAAEWLLTVEQIIEEEPIPDPDNDVIEISVNGVVQWKVIGKLQEL